MGGLNPTGRRAWLTFALPLEPARLNWHTGHATTRPSEAAMPEVTKDQGHEFPTTWWTLIDQALADGTTMRTEALEQLVLRYVPPLRAHLVLRKRVHAELADELLQAFVTEKIVAQYLLRHADRTQGKFRSLLVRSLENFYADSLRGGAARRVTGRAAAMEEAAIPPDPQADIFDIAWARQLLDEVLSAMKEDCDANRQANIWGVFQCRLLAPVYEAVEPIPYEEVCRRFDFASPEQASNALMTAKRKFQRAFECVAAQYRHDGEQSEDILRELIDILSRAGPLEWQQVASASLRADSTGSSSSGQFADLQPTDVARILGHTAGADELWRPEDLGGLLRHQLAQRLADLDLPVRNCPATNAPLVTLSDLFRHPAPPVELLEALKRYGRKHVHRPDARLPDELASALYFASIAAALVRHGQRISKSDDELLRFGFERMLEREWIEKPLRTLFKDGIARLGPQDMPT
jgi:hypothetical protein